MGRGVRSKIFIPNNTNIGCYIGNLKHNSESNNDWIYSFQYVLKDYYIDGQNIDSITSLFNHSDNPNVRVFSELHDADELHEVHITFYTNKDIKIGEELFIDYGPSYWISAKEKGIFKDIKQKLITDYFVSLGNK